jgi:uncharacterized protein GlcG (DUF336 family)
MLARATQGGFLSIADLPIVGMGLVVAALIRGSIMRSIASRSTVMALLIWCVAPAHLAAQGLVKTSRLSATLALEAVGEAVAACAKNGYAVSAVVVTIDGARQAVLRGDGAPVHTLDSAYAKAYTAASLVPVRKERSTKELFERVSKNPSTTTSLGNLPNITFTPGGITIFAGDEPIGGLGVGGAPGGNFDHDCADAALKKIADRMK